MNVRLVSMTKPLLPELADASAEDLIVYLARVSSPSNQLNLDTAEKLIRYCIDHQHWSIFDMVDMTVEVDTSRMISAQVVRHWSFDGLEVVEAFRFQEFSQRYADPSGAGLGFETYEARRQDTKNRQNSIDDLSEGIKYEFRRRQEEAQRHALGDYQWAISVGIAKECARALLPMSVGTRYYMKGSVRSFITYLQNRSSYYPRGLATQKEHRDVADVIAEFFNAQFPRVSAACDLTKRLG